MKTIAASLFVLLLAGWALADPPATQPNYTSFYNCQIRAVGNGTLDVHVLRGPSGIIHPVNVDDKTEVVLPNGRPGKLTDLAVGQWVKVYWNPDANDPKQQRIVKIEPGMAPWAAERLADLEKNAGTLEVGIRLFVNGKGDVEELHLLGPDNKVGYKEPFFARLTKEEMTKLLRYLAVEGFLANAIDGKNADATPKPPAPPYVQLSAGNFYQNVSLTADVIKRLEGIQAVLPDPAAAKMETLLKRVRKIVGLPASQPADANTKLSKLTVERAAKLKADVKTFTLYLDYHGPQDKPYYHLLLSVPRVEGLDDHLRSPFFPLARITEDEAKAIIDFLAVDGFLDEATTGKVHPDVPCYLLTVRVDGTEGRVEYKGSLGWNLNMLHRLDGLRKLLKEDAAKGMDLLLERMSGHRKEWEQQPTSQPGGPEAS